MLSGASFTYTLSPSRAYSWNLFFEARTFNRTQNSQTELLFTDRDIPDSQLLQDVPRLHRPRLELQVIRHTFLAFVWVPEIQTLVLVLLIAVASALTTGPFPTLLYRGHQAVFRKHHGHLTVFKIMPTLLPQSLDPLIESASPFSLPISCQASISKALPQKRNISGSTHFLPTHPFSTLWLCPSVSYCLECPLLGFPLVNSCLS